MFQAQCRITSGIRIRSHRLGGAAIMGAVIRPDCSSQRLAGGNWDNGSNCGSRTRNANNSLSNSNSNVGSRAAILVQFGKLHKAGPFSLASARIYNAKHPLSVATANARGVA